MADSYPKQEPPYGLRMSPDLKDRVKAAAARNNRSMNAEIVATLEEKYPAPEMTPNDWWEMARKREDQLMAISAQIRSLTEQYNKVGYPGPAGVVQKLERLFKQQQKLLQDPLPKPPTGA